jgi:hypothetical protein
MNLAVANDSGSRRCLGRMCILPSVTNSCRATLLRFGGLGTAAYNVSDTKTVGIDIGKNSFHVVGHDERGAIVLRQKWSRGQLEARFSGRQRGLLRMVVPNRAQSLFQFMVIRALLASWVAQFAYCSRVN